MKKNKALTAAFSVFALTMVSMCAIGGTFAKYVTEKEASDTVTVAKWGVEVTANGNTAAVTELDGNPEIHVSGTEGELMAPGTKGTFVSVSVDGDPEVVANVTHEATVAITGWEIDSVYYCPVVVKVNGVAVVATDHSDPVDGVIDASDYAASIEEAIEDLSKTEVAVGTPLDQTITVTWEWLITTDGDATGEKDTKLGNLITAPSITVGISTTVEQVD